MTMVATGGVDEAQRIQLGLSDLAIAMDSSSKRLLSYTPLAMRSSDAAMVRALRVALFAPSSGCAPSCVLLCPQRASRSARPAMLWCSALQARGGAHASTASARASPQVDVDTTFFSERDKLSLRYDLADCGIYICAPEVLMLFSDNFDFQHIQRDFIHGILSEEELGNKLFVHELCGEYGAVLGNLRAYAAVSRDVLMRWLHPLTPDSNLLPPAAEAAGDSDYVFSPPCTCAPLSPPPFLLFFFCFLGDFN